MRTKKMRLISVFLALAMMLLLVPVGAFAEGNSMSGPCGDNISWELTQNNTSTSDPTYTLTISGTGAIADCDYDEQPWYWAMDRITKIEIDDGVTAIGVYNFYGCHRLADVSIPDSVTRIGKSAFEDCYDLRSVTLPDGLKEIDYQAFAYCHTLQSITLPQSVEVLNDYTFYKCYSLHDATLDAVTVGNATFDYCYAMKHATVSNRVESLGRRTFNDCYTLRRVDFEPGSKLTTIGSDTFEDCYPGLKIYCEPSLKASGLLSGRGVADENIITSVEVKLVDGEQTEQKTVDYGTLAGTLGEPTRENSTFLGWYTTDGQKLEPDQWLTDDMTLTARWNNSYRLSFGEDCTAEVEGSSVPLQSGTYVQAGKRITIDLTNKDLNFENFEGYEIAPSPEDLTVQETTAVFTMPESDVEVKVHWNAEESDGGWDAATVAAGVAVGAGTAVLAYHIGTEVYAEQVLGKGVIVPTLRGEVARKAWELAGKPAVAVEGTDEPSESAQAEQWVVESGLMKVRKDGAFHPEQTMTKLKALRVLDNAKKQNAQ